MNRINAIIKLINNANVVADICSDHALLGIELLKNKLAKHVINIDINKKPLENGINNLKKYNLLQFSTNILGNGIEPLNNTEVDVLVISGVGGNLIKKIISNDNINNCHEIVVLPNNNANIVRKWISENNYQIKYESIVKDDNHYYELINFSKSKFAKKLNEKEILFGPYNLKKISIQFCEMWKKHYDHINDNKLYYSNNKLKIKFDLIKEIMKNENWKN